MLAGRGRPPGALHDWAVEPKLDGWRVRVAVAGDGQLVVRSRTGRDITRSVPALRPLATAGVDVLLDGELVAGVGRMADFYRIPAHLAGGGPSAPPGELRFAPFDLLRLGDDDLTGLPYTGRRRHLGEVAELLGLHAVPTYPGEDVDLLLAACEGEGLEGVVLKRLTSRYWPGRRTSEWRKVKCRGWAAHAERRRPREWARR